MTKDIVLKISKFVRTLLWAIQRVQTAALWTNTWWRARFIFICAALFDYQLSWRTLKFRRTRKTWNLCENEFPRCTVLNNTHIEGCDVNNFLSVGRAFCARTRTIQCVIKIQRPNGSVIETELTVTQCPVGVNTTMHLYMRREGRLISTVQTLSSGIALRVNYLQSKRNTVCWNLQTGRLIVTDRFKITLVYFAYSTFVNNTMNAILCIIIGEIK